MALNKSIELEPSDERNFVTKDAGTDVVDIRVSGLTISIPARILAEGVLESDYGLARFLGQAILMLEEAGDPINVETARLLRDLFRRRAH